jgi:hypothetical protein
VTLCPALYVIAGGLGLIALSAIALAVFLAAARAGTRHDQNGDQP